MGLIDLYYEEGQISLDEDEKDGLLIPSVTTKGELDEVEQRNIEDAILWTIQRRRKFTADEILTEQFIKELHRHMFGSVWKWAGTFRNSNKNIGVDKYQVGIELKMLLDDCKFWIANSIFSHRIVAIHCFSNGNGRHSRLIADLIIEKIFAEKIFSWSGKNLIKGSARATYLTAIREADRGRYELLLAFARS